MNTQLLYFPLVFKLIVIFSLFLLVNGLTSGRKILAQNSDPEIFFLKPPVQIETESRFEVKTSKKLEKVPFKTTVHSDPNLEWGKVVVKEKGEVGENLVILEKLFWKGKNVGERLLKKPLKLPQHQVNLIGTKLIPGTVKTPQGELAYKGKIKVYATSYDKNCRGCNETTATGSRVTFGIAAVDPQIIPLGSRIYVEGYGQAIAADTGGAIKGAKIDLAFDDVRNGFWRSRWTDVYLLE